MRRAALTALVLQLVGRCCLAADDPESLSRIRDRMREYLARLPDYTCRVTIERAQRRGPGAEYSVLDRLRLEIAYAGGHEYYAWPGDSRFESTIDELLPDRGLVSEGSWALHMRKLFLTNDAQFGAPRPDAGLERVDFVVPAVRSGFAVTAGGASAPAGLQGSVWFARDTLNIRRLEVRVAEVPRTIRVAATREVTSYADAVVGDVPAVLPVESELVLRDRDGSERRNRARFDDCHRYSGSATVRYEAPADTPAETPSARQTPKRGQRVEMKFESGIGADVAIGDVFTFGAAKVRVTDVRQAGDRWNLEFSLLGARGVARRTLALPAPPGTTITLRVE
jgi:hypothetical protein